MITNELTESDTITVLLSRNDARLRDWLGYVPQEIPEPYIIDGAWIASFIYDGQVVFNLTKYPSPISNVPIDRTLYFDEDSFSGTLFDFWALKLQNGIAIEYSLVADPGPPPDQLFLTRTLFREVIMIMGDTFVSSPRNSPENSELFFTLRDQFAEALKVSSGSWILKGCEEGLLE